MLVTLGYYFLSCFNLNNKTLFISLILLGVVYYCRFKNWRLSLVLITTVSLVFQVGKTWSKLLILPELLHAPQFPDGYIAYVTITPFNIFSLLLLVAIFRDIFINNNFIKDRLFKIYKRKWFKLLGLFFIWRLLAAIMAYGNNILPIIYSLQFLTFFIYLIGLVAYVNNRYFIFPVLCSMIIFEAILALLQWVYKANLGFVIEGANKYLSYYGGPDADFFIPRPQGTFYHPNELACFTLSLIFIPLAMMYFKKDHKIAINGQAGFWFCFLTLILSQGRSAWLSFTGSFLGFVYLLEKKWNRHLINLSTINLRLIFFVIITIVIFLTIIVPRLTKSLEFFKPSAGGETRIKLIEESINLIVNMPWFGAGMGLSGLAMFKLKPTGIISILPSTVHNFYLLLAAESGLPSLMLFILFLYFFVRDIFISLYNLSVNDKIYSLGILAGMVAMLINGFIQQIFLMGFFIVLIFMSYEKK